MSTATQQLHYLFSCFNLERNANSVTKILDVCLCSILTVTTPRCTANFCSNFLVIDT